MERGFNVNKNMLQPNLEILSLMSHRMIHNHLTASSLTPETFTISKELRGSVTKARHRKKAGLANKKEEKYQNEKRRKSEAIRIDMKELKSKILLLEKVPRTLKCDSEKLLCKAADDALNVHAHEIDAKSVMRLL